MESVHCTVTGPHLCMCHRPSAPTLQHVTVPIRNIYRATLLGVVSLRRKEENMGLDSISETICFISVDLQNKTDSTGNSYFKTNFSNNNAWDKPHTDVYFWAWRNVDKSTSHTLSYLIGMCLFLLSRLLRLLLIVVQCVEARRLYRRLKSEREHQYCAEDHANNWESEVGVNNIWQLHGNRIVALTASCCKLSAGYDHIAVFVSRTLVIFPNIL